MNDIRQNMDNISLPAENTAMGAGLNSLQPLAPGSLPAHSGGVAGVVGVVGVAVRPTESPYLTTDEAAAYLRKSVSWLLRVPDMAFLRGKPNLYAKNDLNAWVERHKYRPRVKV
jgi:hypothetical protein